MFKVIFYVYFTFNDCAAFKIYAKMAVVVMIH
jgi:hypothetical protein